MRDLNFRVIAGLVLSVLIIVGYGCSEEEMVQPTPPPPPVWRATDGQIGGHILSIAFNSNDDLYVLLQENRRVLYYTRDGGRIWAVTDAANVDTVFYTIRSFTFNNDDDLFVGTQEGLLFSSSDNGDSLAVMDTLGVGLFVDIRGIISTENDSLFAAVSGAGIYRSGDNGQNWSNVGADLENKTFINEGLIVNAEGDIYSASWGGDVYRGQINGSEWTPLNLFAVGYFPESINCLAFREDNKVIGGYNGFFCYYKTYETDTTKVDMWVSQNNGFSDYLGKSVDIRCLEVGSDGTIYAGTYGGGIFKSTNQGASWKAINDGLPDLQIQDIAIRSDGRIFIATFREGVFYSIW